MTSSAARRFAASLACALGTILLLAQQALALGAPSLVKEILTGTSGSFPHGFVRLGNHLFLSAEDAPSLPALWKTDGTPGGTVKVSAAATCVEEITNVNGTLFFAANDDVCLENNELWKSDGTTATLVKNIEFGGLEFGSYPYDLANFNGILVFSAFTSAAGRELWKSDGTAANTVQIKDIDPGSPSGNPEGYVTTSWGVERFFVTPSRFFFTARDVTNGTELWVSDGNLGGTAPLALNPGGNGVPLISLPNPAALNATTILFAGDDGTGLELWRSNGTIGGTTLVKNIRASGGSDPRDLVNIGGSVYFSANDGVTGRELWRSDGTNAATVRITDLNPAGDSLSTSSFLPFQIVDVNGTIFFPATDGSTGTELWKSDGTTANTQRVKDINPGAAGSSPNSLTVVNGRLYFSADNGTHGYELWTSDGTDAGTVRLSDIASGSGSGLGVGPELAKLNGRLLFGAADTGSNFELWGISLCGDGTTDPPDETCDSGDLNGLDGCCQTTCAVIDGDADLTCNANDNCPSAANPDQHNADGLAESGPPTGDLCDPCPSDPVNGCAATKTACALVGATGGTVTTTTGASLTFPPGALSNKCNDAAHTPCATTADCQAIGATLCAANSVCITGQSAVKHCVGSANAGDVCSTDTQCPGGTCVVNFGSGSIGTNLVGGVADLDPNGVTFAQDVTLTFPWLDANNNGMVESPTTLADTSVEELQLRLFHNGRQTGTCGGSPQTLCSADLPCPGAMTCDLKRCSEVVPPCGVSALCCDTVNNRWTAKVRSFSGYAVGVDCATIADARIRITHLGPPSGDDRLSFTGMMTLPSGLTLGDVDPLAEGLTLLLNDSGGTVMAVTLPAGAFDTGTQTGWKVNAAGNKWKYINRSASPPGGIFSARFLDKSTVGPGLVRVVFKGKDATYPATTSLSVSVVLPDGGDCAATAFAGCASNVDGTTLKCQ